MFIRSQDESIIIHWDNVKNIKIVPNTYSTSKFINYHIVVDDLEIASYSTKVNARIALDKLCHCITEKIDYYMPEDEEVDELWENISQEQNQQQ